MKILHRKPMARTAGLSQRLAAALSLAMLLNAGGCAAAEEPALAPVTPDLIVFTYQEETVYEPILKEYQERTGLSVQILNGTYQELQDRILAGTLADDCDVVFGVNSAALERAPECWEPYLSPQTGSAYPDFYSPTGLWTGFSALPLVIMYNTRVVTYRELPEGWDSLLEPRWRGQVAFMDPDLSDIYSGALTAAVYSSAKPEQYVEAFLNNLEYHTFDNIAAVNQAIAEGRCFLGVTLEEKAESLRQEGADVDYIYPEEGTCILIDSSAIVSGCQNPEQAREFIDFTISKDVQHYLSTTLYRRSVRTDAPTPAGLSQLYQLPLLDLSTDRLAAQSRDTMAEWNRLLPLHAEERR